MKPENEPTPKSRNRLTAGISAAVGAGALIATGLGVVANIDAPKPKETRVESVSDNNSVSPTTEAPATTIAVEQKDMKLTATTVVIPEATTTTITQPADADPTNHVDPQAPEGYQGPSDPHPDYQMPPQNPDTRSTTTTQPPEVDPTYHVDPQAPEGYQGPSDPHPDYQMPPQNPDTTTTTQPSGS